ncbi:hypothetical protein HG536_0D05170 [Torulaspora globosa]|uniref:SIS domain-containing protein n=1 Tax=Torulaspora globosa TaxID=48254 RepID=A0A7G3ZHK9_9SACH|nr:uncharacterized protein HG536_0D05170 [Torulaspora globosa]QLL32995.1 hypothetical protein HG536_0D05170 [Torulaspora globosa]
MACETMTKDYCTDAVINSSIASFKTLLTHHSIQVDRLVDYYYTDANAAVSVGRIIQMLCNCLKARNKIIFVGCGKSLKIANKVVSTLQSMGMSSISMHPTDALHGDIGTVGEGDCIMACSTSGETEEIIQLLKYLDEKEIWHGENGRRIQKVAVTAEAHSTIGSMSDECLLVPKKVKECEVQNGLKAPTVSSTSMLIVLDCLSLALSQAHSNGDLATRNKVFEVMHPGGKIGETTRSNGSNTPPPTRTIVDAAKIRCGMSELDILQAVILYDWIDWDGKKQVPSVVVQSHYRAWKKSNSGAFDQYLNDILSSAAI